MKKIFLIILIFSLSPLTFASSTINFSEHYRVGNKSDQKLLGFETQLKLKALKDNSSFNAGIGIRKEDLEATSNKPYELYPYLLIERQWKNKFGALTLNAALAYAIPRNPHIFGFSCIGLSFSLENDSYFKIAYRLNIEEKGIEPGLSYSLEIPLNLDTAEEYTVNE